MYVFEYLTLIGGILIGMGVVLFGFAIAVAFLIGGINESES